MQYQNYKKNDITKLPSANYYYFAKKILSLFAVEYVTNIFALFLILFLVHTAYHYIIYNYTLRVFKCFYCRNKMLLHSWPL